MARAVEREREQQERAKGQVECERPMFSANVQHEMAESERRSYGQR
jgi:hypothetical protein